MKKSIYIVLISVVFVFPLLNASAKESKVLREQRLKAHNERLAKKRQRTDEIAKAKKRYNLFERDLKAAYKPKLKELDTQFNLKRVELEANAKAKMAELESENRKAMMRYLMKPDRSRNKETIDKMKAEKSGYLSKLFALQKTSDKAIHEERIANEKRKNAILKQRDQLALDKAESLGLMQEYAPILARPIGGGLTKSEERWNEQEKKNSAQIKKNNRVILRKFEREKKIREWRIQNLITDFNLRCRKNEERHKIDSEVALYNALIIYSKENTNGVAQREYLTKLSDLDKKKQLITIKYKKIKEQNRIKRRAEEKKIRFQ
jgi:hypothetical protein